MEVRGSEAEYFWFAKAFIVPIICKKGSKGLNK
jgi:hypothetical protein